MSLIIPRNFKRAKAQGAQDAQGDEVIAQKNGYKLVHNTMNDGYWFYTKSGAGWGITATNKVAAINEFNRLVGSAKDAAELNNDADLRAEDANFKVGDRVKHAKVKSPVQPIGKISEVYNDQRWVEVEWENMPYKYQTIETSNLLPANSRAADACGTDAKLQKGDKVRVWQYPVYGKMGEVVEATYGGMEYTVNVEGKDYPRIDYRRIVKASNAAGDAAEFHVGQRVRAKDPAYEYSDGKSLGAGMFTVKEVNNNGDVKLDDYGDVWISPSALVEANDACEDSAAKFRIGQEVIVKTKYAEPYKARIVGLWDMSQNGPYNEQGYLIKNIKGGGVESMPEHALSLVTAKDSVSDKEREYTRLYELAQKNITFHAAKGDSAKVAEWKRKADEYKRLAQEAENAAEARNAKDSRAMDAKFKIGDKVKLSGSHPRFPNRVAVVTHVFPTGFVKVKVDGIEDIEIAERLISKAQDAAELNNDACGKRSR